MKVDPGLVEELRRLYLDEGLSTYAIAERLELDRQRVTRLLKSVGVEVRPRGSGRRRRNGGRDPGLDALICQLYIDEEMSSEEIGAKLGIAGRAVRARLAMLGVERRPRGGVHRTDRRTIDPDQLESLYLCAGLTADEIGERLGVSRHIVLRAAHDLDRPVHPGGMPSVRGELDVRTITALYDDPQVVDVLTSFAVPMVRVPGTIWERFPTPVALTPELVHRLYEDCGLSHRHIEIVTGVPAVSVARFLRACGISPRPAGGLSPFLRRWRDEQRRRRHASTATRR
ncbi:MAG: hypothetical protein M0004_02315 [Actinomycetota bacterium]|nr:hypothetical protein [Actinomycetota bacterium]